MKKQYFKIFTLLAMVLFMGAGCISFSNNKTGTTGPAGMFVSTDKGETWQQVSNMPTLEGVKNISGVSVYRIIEDPQDNDAMYWSSRGNGLFYTFNSGKSWSHAEGQLSSGFIYSLAVHPKNKCIVYATNGRQIFRTDDCMRHWEEMYRESRSNVLLTALEFNNFPPYEIYLGLSNGDLLRSYDSGNSWSVIKRLGDRILHILQNPLEENLYYIITKERGIYRSDDGAESWKSLKEGLQEFSGGLEYRRYLMHPKKVGTFYWVSTYGILRSDDYGESWSAYSLIHPPGSANIYGFTVNPKNDNEIYYTATINNRSTFYKSLDNGKNWITKKLPSGQLPVMLRVHPDNDSLIYMGFAIPPAPKKTAPKLYND